LELEGLALMETEAALEEIAGLGQLNLRAAVAVAVT
jgi:hypothetical protein